jgi:RNA polymerase sigma-70 factor (ECF subfamily)
LSPRRATTRQRTIAARLAASEPSALPESSDGSDEPRTVLEALAGLHEKEREVLMLAAWEELSSSEAARVLGCSATAYRIRLHRARGRLRERLAESHGVEPEWPPALSARTEETPSC